MLFICDYEYEIPYVTWSWHTNVSVMDSINDLET